MHDPSFSHSRFRLGCFAGTFSPSRRQIRSTRLTFTTQPALRNSAAIRRYGDLLGRRFASEVNRETPVTPPRVPNEFVNRVLDQLPAGLREHAAQIGPRLLPPRSLTPGYFDVLANSINIMQDYITRARLAGEPPHVMLVPRLRHIGLMEFNRAKEAIAEGRLCVEQALPVIKLFV